jgi:hypothetical protein
MDLVKVRLIHVIIPIAIERLTQLTKAAAPY